MTNTAEQIPSPQPQIALEDEMRKSYLDYAMSVIVSRALPDARDGLKPVHRRILFAMKEGGYDSNKPFRKSARIVGDVMGKYHPHGDSAIYDAMVRMAQDFSMSLPLIDGQGNFGSMDGDAAAAMRYTEARLGKSGEALLADIDKNTVTFQPNYDESIYEPTVVPARIPNLLVNGASGIAVGMATNIPPHNLGEVVDACIALVDDPELTIEDLMQFVPAPDFPTGGQIMGRTGARNAYMTGNGSVIMRAKTHFEDLRKDKTAIIVDEVPYQVNKAKVLERISELVREKQIDGITDLRDESDRDGVRVVIELRRDAQPDVVLNQLFKFTALETSFGCNMLALNMGRPQTFNLKQFIQAFVAFREDVITKRTAFDLNKARDRAHVLIGLAVAVANLDPVIALIRKAADPATARAQLMATPWPAKDMGQYLDLIDDPLHRMNADGTYTLSETQAKAILDLRLHRLTGLERDKILDELKTLMAEIKDLLDILGNRPRLLEVLKDELREVREKFAVPRRSEIMESVSDMDMEDLIPREDMVVTVTNGGYVKRVPLAAYRAQKRGGKGKAGMTTKDDDFVTDLFVASTHTPILFFSSGGYAYKLKVWQLPLGNAQSKGKALVNILPIDQGENVSVYLRMPEDMAVWEKLDLMFATSHGTVRRNRLSDFGNIRANGLIAMKLEDGEKLVSVRICKDGEDVLLATRKGKAMRFDVSDVRVFASRGSTGVRGVRLAEGDEVMSMSILKDGEASTQLLLTISENGYGKRTAADEYRRTNRGGSGVINMDVTEKTGQIVATLPVNEDHQIMLVSDQGQMIRTDVSSIRTTGRSAQGVRVFNVSEGEKVVSFAVMTVEEEGEEETDVITPETEA